MRGKPGDRWRPLTAQQTISIHEPGFLWIARMKLAPAMHAHILDAYIDDEGVLEARLFGSLPLARASGPAVARSELMRYLAELAWAPHAMLYNPRLCWREIDATTVEVAAASRGGPVRVRLLIENGDLMRVEADDRPRLAGRRVIPTAWRGYFLDYRRIGGCRIPTRAVASWLLPDGLFDYWRGQITAFTMT